MAKKKKKMPSTPKKPRKPSKPSQPPGGRIAGPGTTTTIIVRPIQNALDWNINGAGPNNLGAGTNWLPDEVFGQVDSLTADVLIGGTTVYNVQAQHITATLTGKTFRFKNVNGSPQWWLGQNLVSYPAWTPPDWNADLSAALTGNLTANISVQTPGNPPGDADYTAIAVRIVITS